MAKITKTIRYKYDGNTIVDVHLFKAIGLYQLLLPTADSGDSDSFKPHRTAILVVLSLIIVLVCMQIVRLYLILNDLYMLLYMTMILFIIFICTLKRYVMLTNVDKLGVLMDVTRYDLMSCGRWHLSRWHRCQDALSAWLRVFVTLSSFTAVLWIVTPLLMDEYVPLVKLDGTVGQFRTSVFNMWYPVPQSVYNWRPIWALIYAIESSICILDVYNYLMFDCYFITICVALNTQFDTMSAAYETLGRCHQSTLPSRSSVVQIESKSIKLNCYEDLILHIEDNKKIMKKLNEFVDVIRPVVIVQIIISSFSMITLIFCTIQAYVMGHSLFSGQVLKLLFAYFLFTIQLFIYCYSLNRIETAKSSINFGLYSCNWTIMDLKFKKTLLLAMEMNSANELMIRLSPRSFVNLKMFAGLVKMSFSIVSVLLNTRIERNL